METITNIAQSAVKAVWGSSPEQKEPVSGAQGDVAKGEPFDAGNKGEMKKLSITNYIHY